MARTLTPAQRLRRAVRQEAFGPEFDLRHATSDQLRTLRSGSVGVAGAGVFGPGSLLAQGREPTGGQLRPASAGSTPTPVTLDGTTQRINPALDPGYQPPPQAAVSPVPQNTPEAYAQQLASGHSSPQQIHAAVVSLAQLLRGRRRTRTGGGRPVM